MTVRRIARPPVLRGIPLDRHTVLEASAGTGKTFTLEHLVVELLVTAAVPIDRVLVVSFTEKATAEIRARVRAKLESLIAGGEEATGGALDEGDFWAIDDAARERLEASLRAFDGATIATIHAFCQRVLREHAFDGGRLFEEEPIDGRHAFGKAMREALRRRVAREPESARWLEASLRAGRSVDDLEELLWSCLQKRGELRPAFDARALDAAIAAFPVEDARRPDTAAEMKRSGARAQTADALASRLLKVADAVERAKAGEGAPGFVAAMDRDRDVLSKLLERLPGVEVRPGPLAEVSSAALCLAKATPTLPAAVAHVVLPAVCEELARRKREAGQYDFDDMLTLVDDALRGPRGAALAAAMRERWRYVLIDEFQDTDETQWSIFRRAFVDPSPGGRSVVYLVGDPKQSIYRFRGADVETYLDARDRVVRTGGARLALDRNYRSTPALVDAVNRLFDAAGDSALGGGLDYEPCACGRPDRALVDADGRAPAPVHVFRIAGGGDFRAVLRDRIAREVRTILDPARPWRIDGRPLGASDVFVLTRTGRESLEMGDALRRAGVPYAFYKQDGLFQTEEANDVRALLASLDDPGDRPRRLQAWLTPFFGLRLADLEGAAGLPASHPLVARLYAWKALADARDFDRLFERVLADSGVVRREIFFGEGERRLTNYLHVFELLAEHAHRARPTLRELVLELSGLIEQTRVPFGLEGNVQRLESERRAVQIMTIHKAKGLEAPVVFVAGGFSKGGHEEKVRVYHEGGRRLAWVGGGARGSDVQTCLADEERDEDHRLMYVALTRAQGRLVLPCVVDGSPGEAPWRSKPRALQGPYDAVNRRLTELLALADPLFAVEDLSPFAVARAANDDAAACGAPSPPPPAAPALAGDSFERFARLRRSRAGAFVTSYTRLKGDAPEIEVEPPPRPRRGEGPGARAERATELRGARASGVFLHELLERVPLVSFGAGEPDAWGRARDVSALFDEACAAYGIDASGRAAAERLVWTAFTTPLPLPGGGRVDRLASAARVAREMDFVFAVPGAASGRARGFVRGSIDLAFEHDGLTYFVDWKSDSLASYAGAPVAEHVAAQYGAQARLYALAVAKLLGCGSREDYEARFGGMLFCFLRGLDARGGGIWTARPAWHDLLAWDEEVRALGPVRAGGRP